MSDREDTPGPGPHPEPSSSEGETPYEGLPRGGPGSAEPLPERIGPYRVERRLGRGGMGEVFLAWDDRLKRRVAIKRIRREISQSFEQREKRFRLEACAPACLSHSAIVQVHDIVTDDAGDAIVMEYVEGSTLAERLAAGPLSVRDALRLAREIAEGLAAIHAEGWIHRDLKAENVIITPQGQAKILDFGLVKSLVDDPGEQALTREGVLLGTFPSMSPEQASGGDVDERSDLFSLGTLLYEMLAGDAPFRGENPLDTLNRVINYCPPPLSTLRRDLPPGLSDLVDRLLAKSRDHRPHSAGAAGRELGDLEAKLEPSSAESVSEMPTGDWTKAVGKNGRDSRRANSWGDMSSQGWRRLAVVTGAVALVAVAGGVLSPSPQPNPPPSKPSRPLRIAVLRPEVKGASKDERLELAATAALSSAVATLSGLQGLEPFEQLDRKNGSHAEIAQAGAANEILLTSLEPIGEDCRLSLQRIRVNDEKIERTLGTEALSIPNCLADLRTLAESVAEHVARAYSNYSLRPEAPKFQLNVDVRAKDYAGFLAVKRERDAGEVKLVPELAQLQRVVLQGSPRFLEAQYLAADISLALHKSTRDPQYLQDARGFIQQAAELAPTARQTLIMTFMATLAGDLPDEAERTLTRLDKLSPGDAEVLALHARLEDKMGRTTEAVKTMRKVAELAPSWRNLAFLGTLEGRAGEVEAARGHFMEILNQDPNNQMVLDRLANFELLFGELDKAEAIYERLTQSSPSDRSSFTNLGMARFFRRRYIEAAAAYRHALTLEANSIDATLNLADVEAELGHQDKANALYRQVLQYFDDNPAAINLQAKDRMTEAQCLARLGLKKKAIEVAQEALQKNPDDMLILAEAALVYCLVGNNKTADKNARAALEKGVQMRWFNAYTCLREDPDIGGFPEAAQRY